MEVSASTELLADAMPTVGLKFLQCTVHIHIHLASESAPVLEELADAIIKNTESTAELAEGLAAFAERKTATDVAGEKIVDSAWSDDLEVVASTVRAATKLKTAILASDVDGAVQHALAARTTLNPNRRPLRELRSWIDAAMARLQWRRVKRRDATGRVSMWYEAPGHKPPAGDVEVEDVSGAPSDEAVEG
jgi:hypothetical protein